MDITAWRKAQGLTQKEAAKRLGVDIRTVQRWESGERRPPPYLARLLAIESER